MSGDLTVVASNAAAKQPSWLTRFCRDRIITQLGDLTGGRLQVTDCLGGWAVGEPGPLDATLEVTDPKFYVDVALEGSLGAARAWVDARWTTNDLTGLLRLMVRNVDQIDALEGGSAWLANSLARLRHFRNRNSRAGSSRNIHAHYDLGNDLFGLFLDSSMTYSSGVFPTAQSSLEEAQTEKLDRICRKLQLEHDDHVLEIGTGWGSFAIHAARHYGCHVTTTTISREQRDLALERIEAAGLSDRIDVRLEDYRDLTGTFDKLVSIEMIEAVGHAFLPEYFATCSRLVKPDGAMLIQAITMPDQRYAKYLEATDFIQAMVFPGSCCPALSAMLEAVKGNTDLSLAHLEDIGPHYARTLKAWRERFESRLGEARELGYSPAFTRLWLYYLAYCEAGFEERYTGTVQLLFEKPHCRASRPALAS